MLKSEMEKKIFEYKEIIRDIGRWVNPIQYKLTEITGKQKLLFHIDGIKNLLKERFYI